MYRSFKLDPLIWKDDWVSIGEASSEANAKKIRDSLEKFVTNGEINGTQLKDHWFPGIKADVFISHSHSDQQDAWGLAGWLSTRFGLVSFVDSCVWGYSDDLLKQIDEVFCKNKSENTYDYQKRNGTTSHVHMMLATAIARMLDDTECIIFASSPQAVTIKESVSVVSSPWIYYELSMMKVLPSKMPSRPIPLIKESSAGAITNFSRQLNISYEADFSSLTKVDRDKLVKWGHLFDSNLNNKHPLDLLYEAVPHKF